MRARVPTLNVKVEMMHWRVTMVHTTVRVLTPGTKAATKHAGVARIWHMGILEPRIKVLVVSTCLR